MTCPFFKSLQQRTVCSLCSLSLSLAPQTGDFPSSNIMLFLLRHWLGALHGVPKVVLVQGWHGNAKAPKEGGCV
jgi:hypothetical protein